MNAEQVQEIESLKKQTDCRKDFECIKSNVKILCKAEYYGENLVLCLENEGSQCKYTEDTNRGNFCGCPVRKLVSAVT